MTTIPHNQELERHIIGNVLIDRAFDYQSKRISTLDFHIGTNQQIWSVLCEMDEDGEPLDITTMHPKLVKKFEDFCLRMADLTNFTWGLAGGVSKKNVDDLKELSTQREIKRKCEKIAGLAEKKEEVPVLIDELESLIQSLKADQDKAQGNGKLLLDVFENDVFPKLDKFVSGEMVKIPFGFSKLDDSTNGGMALGELVVLGAKPKSGKSVMAINIADNVAYQQIGTYVCSREMLNYENGFRLLAKFSSKYSINNFRSGMYEYVADSLKEDAKYLAERPLILDDKTKTVKDAKKEINRFRDLGVDIKLAVFDYAQLMRGENVRGKNKADIIEEIIYDLKDLATELEIAVLVNSQFNNDGIKATKPTMADFHGSSAISKAANIVLIWTLEDEISSISGGRNGELWIEAGRSVAYDKFDVIFYGEKAMFNFA